MLRVLLVEDNDNFRKMFKMNLSELFPDLEIEEASSSEEALKKTSGNPPDIIFMDIRLPTLNGLQLTQKMKRDFPDSLIAILTGYDLPEYRKRAFQYGADAFFVKESLKWDEVESLVKSVIFQKEPLSLLKDS